MPEFRGSDPGRIVNAGCCFADANVDSIVGSGGFSSDLQRFVHPGADPFRFRPRTTVHRGVATAAANADDGVAGSGFNIAVCSRWVGILTVVFVYCWIWKICHIQSKWVRASTGVRGCPPSLEIVRQSRRLPDWTELRKNSLNHVSAGGSDSYSACECWGVKVGVGLVVRRSWWAVLTVSGSGHLVELRLLVVKVSLGAVK